MSSQMRDPSETTRLLGDLPSGDDPVSRSSSRESRRISPETLLIPVALATRLASLLPATTLMELVRQIVCKLWQASHGDQSTLPTGSIYADLCGAPEIQRYFSMAIAIIGVVGAIIEMLTCGLLSQYSSHYGRKPALSLALIGGIVSGCFIAGSQSVPDWLSGWLFVVGIMMQSFSGAFVSIYLVNAYTVDVCVPEDRTAALSRVAGWATLGSCISFATGGVVTTKTGNPLIVFYIAAAIFLVTLLYVIAVLPETFTEEKRKALVRMRSEQSNNELSSSAAVAPSSLFSVFEPLKVLVPSTNADGSRNWRLALLAVHLLVVATASGYAGSGWLVLATSKYNLTPAESRLVFSSQLLLSAL